MIEKCDIIRIIRSIEREDSIYDDAVQKKYIVKIVSFKNYYLKRNFSNYFFF